MDKDCNELGILFQQIVSDIKSSFPLWEDFTNKAIKLHSALRCTVSASTTFLDAFQKLADCASGTRGATADIGSSLTRLCLRHRAIETRLKNYTISLIEALVAPLQDRMDDWRKSVVQLEKDHAKEYKKCHSELKKASGETSRLQKKVNKGRAEFRGQLEEATTEMNSRFAALEASEKNAVTLALTEQRSHLCHLISCVKPLVDQEIAMVFEAEHLKEIIENMSKLATKPPSLALSSEEVLADVTRCLQLQSTIERKKRVLKDDNECESMSNSSGSTSASLDALNLCTGSTSASSAAQKASQNAQPTQHATISVGKSQTYLYGNLPVKTRQSYTCDTFNPVTSSSNRQEGVAASSKPENPYAVPTTLPSQSWNNSIKVVDKIYARPALVMNKESGSTLKRVMTPTVPSLARVDESSKVMDFPTSGYITKNDLAGLAKLREMSEDLETKNTREGQHITTSKQSDFASDSAEMSLADALRELEASTALLEVPYAASSAQSCQSLQCSSGYGTLANVSSNSAETVASFPADLDALANALLASSCDFPDLDKCSTLPSKRQMYDATPPSLRRPASTAGIESAISGTKVPAQKDETFESTGTVNYNPYFSAASCISRPPPSHSSFPPEAAYNRHHHQLHTMHIQEDDMDDLPLPPPPEDFDICPLPVQTIGRSQTLSMHANVMQSLNEKLSTRKTPAADLQRSSSVMQHAAPGHQVLLRSTQRATEAEDAATDPTSFEHQIRRGVKLRHTICNDRSAPKVIRH